MASPSHAGRPNKLFRNLNAKIASIPMVLTALVIFLGGTIWTVVYSFTNSKLLPRANFVGFDQYERLWDAPRWVMSIQNLAIYGILSLIFSIVIGFVLAALMDQKIRFENTFRTILSLSLRPLFHRHRSRLAVDPQPGFRGSVDRAFAGLGDVHVQPALQFRASSSTAF